MRWPETTTPGTLKTLETRRRSFNNMADSDQSADADQTAPDEFDWYPAWLDDPDASEEARWARRRNHETPPALDDVMQWWAWDGPSNSERAAIHVAAPLLALYRQRDKDARHVWRAYKAIRHAGMTVPEVVLKIFDEWAEAIEGVDGLPAMAGALSLPRKQGTATTARHASDMRNSVRIVRAVAIHLERMRTNAERAPQLAGRASERGAIRLAARDLRMAVSVVKGHWARWSASEKPPPAAPTTEGPTLESAWGLRPGGSP